MLLTPAPYLFLRHELVELHLPRAAENAHARWTSRRAVLVTLTNEAGRVGRGEAAPLPGISLESTEDVLAALAEIGSEPDFDALVSNRLPASLRFALDCALFELCAENRPLHRVLFSASKARIPNVLELQILLDSLDDAVERAHRARAQGARTFKVKVGRPGQARAESELLEALRALGDDIVLRCDANGRLDEPEILASAMARTRVEYIEDPFPLSLDSTDSFSQTERPRLWCGVPLALDAAMHIDPSWVLARAVSLGASYLVLKPSLLGGLATTMHLAARARARGLRVVLSHLFEGPVGLAALGHLAFAIAASRPRALWGAQGIAPWSGIDAWPGRALPQWIEPYALKRPTAPGLGLSA